MDWISLPNCPLYLPHYGIVPKTIFVYHVHYKDLTLILLYPMCLIQMITPGLLSTENLTKLDRS